jgi:phage tail-like protein
MKTKTIVLSAVVVLALLAGGVAYVALSGDDDGLRRTGAISTTRTYTGGNYFLELNGTSVGALRSIEGCGVEAEVIQAAGAEKMQGQPRYGPCELRFGGGMGASLYQWIADSFAGKNAPKNAAIVVTDLNYKAVTRLELTDTLLTKFTIPTLDAASTETLAFEVTLEPQQIRKLKGNGATVTQSKTLKQLLLKNFRVTSPGLGSSVSKASKVESWSFTLPVSDDTLGTDRLATKTVGTAKLDDVTITAAEPLAEVDALIDGLAAGTPKPTTLRIELLDATLKETLVDLNFTGAGLQAAELLSEGTGGETSIAKRAFSMFVSAATLKFNNLGSG